MVAVQGAFNDIIRPGATAAFADEYPSLPAIYPGLLPVITSAQATEEWLITTGLGTMPEKPEGEPTPMDTPIQVGKVKISHISYGIGYGVSHELMINDLYGAVVKPSSRFLAQSQRDTEERIAHGIFNNAFTTQQAYDGVSIINTAHPITAGATTTQANRPAAAQALGVGGVQASVERFRRLVNERNLKIQYRPETLLVPIELEWRAQEITQSQFKPFTANNEINPVARLGLKVESSEFLTSATAWFMLSPKSRLRIWFIWRQRPVQSDDFLESEWIARFFNRSIFSIATVDYRGIDGTTG